MCKFCNKCGNNAAEWEMCEDPDCGDLADEPPEPARNENGIKEETINRVAEAMWDSTEEEGMPKWFQLDEVDDESLLTEFRRLATIAINKYLSLGMDI